MRKTDPANYSLKVVWITTILFACQPAQQANGRARTPHFADHLVVVSEQQPLLLAAAAPIVHLLSKQTPSRPHPVLIAVEHVPQANTKAFVSDIMPRQITYIGRAPRLLLAKRPPSPRDQHLAQGTDEMDGAVALAKSFWKAPAMIVCAPMDEPAALIAAATLAAHRAVPFVPVIAAKPTETKAKLAALARQLNTRKVVFASNNKQFQQMGRHPQVQIEVLNGKILTERIIAALSPAPVANIIVARTPEDSQWLGTLSYLAPYWSWVRRSPLLLVDTSDAQHAEDLMAKTLAAYRLAPQTITILADYSSIGPHYYEIKGEETSYTLSVEPFVLPEKKEALPYGVGRIPFETLPQATALLVRGLLRDRILAERARGVLVVANVKSSADDSGLPLGELISLSTVAELTNMGLPVTSFFREEPNNKTARTAATDASLILYEGHIGSMRLFEGVADPIFDEAPPAPLQESNERQDTSSRDNSHASTSPPPASAPPLGGADPLTGVPIVVLQACNSLDRHIVDPIFASGGVAILGTATNVHSASGGSLAKSFLQGLTYRGETMGEALRDAQNYFFALQDLKTARGHTEQSKSFRVALSFRLWGDPQLKAFPSQLRPKKRTIRAKFDGPAVINVKRPKRKLKRLENEKYTASLFPGVQLAGMVKRLKERKIRKVTPLYFFRLTPPKGFVEHQFRSLWRAGSKDKTRGVFRLTPDKRTLYVLYYPKRDKRAETLSLHFGK